MNVVFEAGGSKHLQGLAATLVVCGHSINIWDSGRKSFYDMFDECRPELFFAHSSTLNKYWEKVLSPAGIHVIDLDQLPAIRLANIAQFYCGKKNPKYQSEILYVSDVPVTDLIVQSIKDISKSMKIRVLGQYPINCPEYVGVPTIQNIADSIKSTDMIIDFSEDWRWDANINNVRYRYIQSSKDLNCLGTIYKEHPEAPTYFGLIAEWFDGIGIDADYILQKEEDIYAKVNNG